MTKKNHPFKPAYSKLSLNLIALSTGALAGLLSMPLTALENKHLSLEQQLRQAPGTSLDEVARQIRRDHNWRILAAEPRIIEEKTIYRFKLLNRKRGRVKVIEVEPAKKVEPLIIDQIIDPLN